MRLSSLVERAGNGRHGSGSITAFYTVLTENDDPNDPIADNARAILDGHIVLSRRLADAGHYPAIDIESSISRVMASLVTPEQLSRAQRLEGPLVPRPGPGEQVATGEEAQASTPLEPPSAEQIATAQTDAERVDPAAMPEPEAWSRARDELNEETPFRREQ